MFTTLCSQLYIHNFIFTTLCSQLYIHNFMFTTLYSNFMFTTLCTYFVFPLSLSFRHFHLIDTLIIRTSRRRCKESDPFFFEFTGRLGRNLPSKRAARSVLRCVQCRSDVPLMDKVGTAFVYTVLRLKRIAL